MKIRRMNEEIDQNEEIKNYFSYTLHKLLSDKQSNNYVEFLKSLNLTEEQYIKLAEFVGDVFDEGRESGVGEEGGYPDRQDM